MQIDNNKIQIKELYKPKTKMGETFQKIVIMGAVVGIGAGAMDCFVSSKGLSKADKTNGCLSLFLEIVIDATIDILGAKFLGDFLQSRIDKKKKPDAEPPQNMTQYAYDLYNTNK